MKLKMIFVVAALSFAANGLHASDKMDCCKDEKCTCCAKKPDDTGKPHEDMKH